ncbi:Serine/threonine-protein kinase PknB [Phycisphaerae bacterium RAS1]|nr:Serine/threonine-protein kinase PknB [Phycisphaerae bacterium RAS1]
MADSAEDTQISRLVVERQYATDQEVKAASEQQKKLAAGGSPRPLADVLVDLGFLTRTQLGRLMGANDDSGGRPAQQIPGYQIQKKVGAGAMAVVYKGRQLSLNRTVAIKILPKRMSKNAEFVERFYREGRAAAQLNHNNIVQAIDVGEAGGFHYFVMEFVEGCTVYDELAQNLVYAEKEAIGIITQIANALSHAHERGFIHRDVKPKNIMLTKERVAKLADMGLARETTDLDAAMAEAGRAYGTPYYISPEQIRGEVDIDARADLYSLGATFYHMVTGRVPFEGATPSTVMHKHLKEAVTPPDHLNTRLTAGCGAMIEKLLAKNREERYPSARELLEDLDLLEHGQSPRYVTSTHMEHSAFERLAAGRALEPEAPPPPPSTNNTWVVILSIICGVSILINIVQALA